jgi:hypothetical protein
MGDVSNLLLDLKRDLEDADEFLARASSTAQELMGDDPEQDDPGWPLMGNMIDQIAALQTLLRALKRNPELVKSFEEARADLDHLADLADGASY